MLAAADPEALCEQLAMGIDAIVSRPMVEAGATRLRSIVDDFLHACLGPVEQARLALWVAARDVEAASDGERDGRSARARR